MKDITNREMQFLLTLFKNPKKEYHTSDIARHLDMSAMGALKIAKRLEKENLLIPKKLGNAIYYKLNSAYLYTKEYLSFLLRREAEEASPHVKAWIRETRKIKNAQAAILFGSILKKQEAEDIDVLFITKPPVFESLKKEIELLNKFNPKKIHPLYQTEEDLKKNLETEDKVVQNALKGIVAFGQDELVQMIL